MTMQTIRFTRTHERYGEFSDAVTVADDATPEQIQALQDQRFTNWVNFIENPPPPPTDEPPVEG